MTAGANQTWSLASLAWAKQGFLAALLFAALYLVGVVCRRMAVGYAFFFAPSAETVWLLIWVFIALLCAVLAASVFAALVRPVRLALLGFGLSCATFLAGWEFTPTPAILSGIYFLLAALYLRSVAGELDDRIRFSAGGLCQPQPTLLLALGVLVSGSVYFAQADQIEREGFRFPEAIYSAIRTFPEAQIQREVETGRMSPDEGQRAQQEITQQLEEQFAEWERALKPFAAYVPMVPALAMYQLVLIVFSLVGWLPRVVLWAAFWLLRRTGFAREAVHTAVVHRLVLT